MVKLKNFVAGLTCIVLAAIALSFVSAAAPPTGFAVVELFTSEGCSSCPPADALVARVQKQYKGNSIYILAYHVDYWNRLGWKDNFSSSEFSKRQRDYAKYLKLQTVYTPQIVVNGKTEFVGSEAGTLGNAIKRELQSNAQANLTISAVEGEGNSIMANYTTNTKPGIDLILALVEKQANTDVKAGENKGKNLSHVQVVRDLFTIKLSGNKNGRAGLRLPDGVKPENAEIIGLLQNTITGEIIGAAKADI